MLKLDYQLSVHCPCRPFEDHVIDMKTKGELNFDVELIRLHSAEFLTKALVGDAMLLYPPSQIVLAALSHGLERLEKSPDLLKNY
uniref:Cyclin C-terminal domain-containing protein n=1 Tax=Ditylenchus dipsaci TaxID=166011 RepID=A0A915DXF9_9BILA